MDIKKMAEELSLSQEEMENAARFLESEYGIVAAKREEKSNYVFKTLTAKERTDHWFKRMNQL